MPPIKLSFSSRTFQILAPVYFALPGKTLFIPTAFPSECNSPPRKGPRAAEWPRGLPPCFAQSPLNSSPVHSVCRDCPRGSWGVITSPGAEALSARSYRLKWTRVGPYRYWVVYRICRRTLFPAYSPPFACLMNPVPVNAPHSCFCKFRGISWRSYAVAWRHCHSAWALRTSIA